MPTLENGKSPVAPSGPGRPPLPSRPNIPWFRWTVLAMLGLSFLYLYRVGSMTVEGGIPQEISYGEFFQWLTAAAPSQVVSAELTENLIQGKTEDGRRFRVYVPDTIEDPYLVPVLREKVPSFRVVPPRTFWVSFLFNLLSPLLFFLALWLLFYRGAQGGGRLLSFGKSRARQILPEEGQRVTFQDVAGVEEAKEELQEVIEFLKDPRRFQRLGGKIPKGVLLLGPPGCGKTLMAKAVAGEAGVPFFSISGSDFVEMFVGVGASRVRDLFDQAKKSAKISGRGCIIFIDEIDAVGRQRFAGIGGGHDEREQTLNALLVEMDGFNTQEGVILVAASVTGDTPILIEENGVRRMVPIGEFVDRFYAPGESDTEKPVSGIRTLGYVRKAGYSVFGNKFEVADFQPVRGVYRHKVDHVYRIRYKGGEVRATGSHSVFVSYRGGIRAVRVDQLKPGDVLVDLPYKVNRTTARRELRALATHSLKGPDALAVIPEFDRWQEEYRYALSQRGLQSQSAVAQRLGVSQTTISGWQRGVKRPRRLGRQDYRHPVPPVVPVTNDLARFFGLLVAEGSLESPRHRITFSFNVKEGHLVQEVKELMMSLFQVNSPYVSHPEPTETCVSFKNSHLTQFLVSQVGRGARGKRLPAFLYDSPREVFLSFLKAYMEGDGYEDKVGRHIACTVNRSLATELNWLCRLHGIKSTVREIDVPARVVRGRNLEPTQAYLLEIGKRNWPGSGYPSFTRRAKVLSVVREPYDGYVYDLCGCGNEAFFGGINPILLHNTNRPDVLDPALLRPGRFDRQVVIDRPDLKGREEILKVHVRKIKLSKSVDLNSIARQTPGFSGADLANLANEAALLAARHDKEEVGAKEMEASIERVMAGPERRSRVISPYEKSIVACHEAGHALVSMMIPGADPVHKVSIIPRGTAALGYTMQMPLEDRYIMTRRELFTKLAVLLGGRSAEELTFGEITTGAQNDLEIATDIARRMVCEYGMSDRLGSLTYGHRQGMVFLGRDIVEERNYSDSTALAIDQEIHRIVDESHQRAKEIITQHKDRLKRLADALLEKEVLDGDEAKRIVMADSPSEESGESPGASQQPFVA